jgi:hypothetical protein
MRTPIPAPGRLHPIFPTGRVHFRQAFQFPRSFAKAHQGSELLHVCQGSASGVEPTVEAGALDFRFRRPLETTLAAVPFEFELADEH